MTIERNHYVRGLTMRVTTQCRQVSAAIVAVVLLGVTHGACAQAPSAPSVTGPDYSVSYVMASGANYVYLEEKFGANGSWQSVPGPYNGGTVNFTGKPAGDYYYRKGDSFTFYDPVYNFPYNYVSYSPEAHVIVTNGPIPTRDSWPTQLTYQYEARGGDIDCLISVCDGRTDLFVRRVSGGEDGNGTLGTFVLHQLADKSFTPLMLTPSQEATASTWPLVNVGVEVSDANIDGFVDVITRGIGNVIAGALDQIVFAPGAILNYAPTGVSPITDQTHMFFRDLSNWEGDNNYFEENAIQYVQVWTVIEICPNGYDYQATCYWVPWFLGYAAQFDSSNYSEDAYSFADVWSRRVASGGIVGGTADATSISDIIRRIVGKPPIILSQTGGAAIPADDIPGEVDVPWKVLSRIGGWLSVIVTALELSGDTPQYRELYRVVGDNELADIRACHCFQTVAGQQEVKQFWLNIADATIFANFNINRARHRTMVGITVSRYVFDMGVHTDEPGTTQGALNFFPGTTLEELNTDILGRPILELKQWDPE